MSRSGIPGISPPVLYVSPASYSEGFDDITILPDWYMQNNSDPLGSTGWFQGNFTVFPAHAGAPPAYIAANVNNTSGAGTISNWLLTPEQVLGNGATLNFWTRTATGSTWPDRLQVRLSTAGPSTDVGTGAEDVGVFTTLLLDINPTLTVGGYPDVWTQYTITLSGIPGGSRGRLAFRYYVTDGGLSGVNSNYIGIDTVEFTDPPPSIALSKTVGTDPLVCAATDAITMTVGTEVSYCYEVTNTGGITLTLHDLQDTELGVILDDFAYALAPGASVSVTQTATISATTVNTATWAAFNQIPYAQVTASHTALVTVTDPTYLEVGHLAPFAADPGTAVTITLNGEPALTNFEYGESTGYIELVPGDYDVAVWLAGSTTPVISGTVRLMTGTYYTAIAIGDGVNQPLSLLALVDDLTPPAAGQFHLRLGHLAPFGSGEALADIRLQDGTLITTVAYSQVTAFMPLDAGEYDLKVTTPGGAITLIDPLPVTFNAGDIVSAFATGDGTNQSLGAFAWPAGVPGDFLPLASYGVELSPATDAKSGAPGETVMYTLSVTNTGDITGTYEITATAGWDVQLPDTGLTLGPGEIAPLMVNVNIPADAADGESDVATVMATSRGDPTVSDQSVLTTTAEILPVYAVELSPSDAAQSGAPGETVEYTLTVTNTGNITDTYEITATIVWDVQLPVTGFTLGPGESAPLTVNVNIPAYVPNGGSDAATVTVISVSVPSSMAESELTTTALIPTKFVFLPLLMDGFNTP